MRTSTRISHTIICEVGRVKIDGDGDVVNDFSQRDMVAL